MKKMIHDFVTNNQHCSMGLLRFVDRVLCQSRSSSSTVFTDDLLLVAVAAVEAVLLLALMDALSLLTELRVSPYLVSVTLTTADEACGDDGPCLTSDLTGETLGNIPKAIKDDES